MCLLDGRGEGERDRANEGGGEQAREGENKRGRASKKTFQFCGARGSVELERRPCR